MYLRTLKLLVSLSGQLTTSKIKTIRIMKRTLLLSFFLTILYIITTFGQESAPLGNDSSKVSSKSNAISSNYSSSVGGNCKDYLSNCKYLKVTSQKALYAYKVTATYTGNDRVSDWTLIGGKKISTSSRTKSTSWRVSSHGTYTVCINYWCGLRKYKCCKEIKIKNGY